MQPQLNIKFLIDVGMGKYYDGIRDRKSFCNTQVFENRKPLLRKNISFGYMNVVQKL